MEKKATSLNSATRSIRLHQILTVFKELTFKEKNNPYIRMVMWRNYLILAVVLRYWTSHAQMAWLRAESLRLISWFSSSILEMVRRTESLALLNTNKKENGYGLVNVDLSQDQKYFIVTINNIFTSMTICNLVRYQKKKYIYKYKQPRPSPNLEAVCLLYLA